MRIAFDMSSTRGIKTGIGIYTENLISALEEFAPGIEVVKLHDGASADQRTPARIWREQVDLPRLASRSRANLLHLTGFASPWRASCPVVLNAHDLAGALFPGNFPPVSRLYWSRYLPFTFQFAIRLIVLAESTKSDIVRIAKISPNRIHVIPPGRDPKFRPVEDGRALADARTRLGLPVEFLLFVSTLEPRKGVDTLIAAFSLVAGEIPFDLVIVGRGGWYWEKSLEQVRLAGLEGRVRFLNYVSAEDLVLIYNLATVFVFPSRYEGFGLTPLEAMGCGLPVISSNASSLPEVVGDAGVLVAPDDINGFAVAITRVARDAELKGRLREQGLLRARRFSWENAARATVGVYESALGEGMKGRTGGAERTQG